MHKKNLAIVFSAGGLSGGCWGIVEAVWRLVGSANGSYDALFWSYSFYLCVGVVFGCFLFPLDMLLAKKYNPSVRWSSYFVLVFVVFSLWVFGGWLWVGIAIPAVWMGDIFLRQSPLKIILTPRGSMAMAGLLLILTFVFSLTTGPIPRKLQHPDSFVHNQKNVLILSIEGLRQEDIVHHAPNLALMRSRSVSFSHTYSDSLDAQKAMTAVLGGQHGWMRKSYITEEFESLAEIFLQHGYHTTAIVNEISLGVHSGLDQGFESYTYLPPQAPLPFTEGARRVKLIDRMLELWASWGADPGRYHRSSFEVLRNVQTDIEGFGEENWFAFAQLRDLEHPYFFEHREGFVRASVEEEQAAYRARLHKLDASLGTFFRWLEQRQQEYILVLMSTHPPHYSSGPPRFQVPLSIMVPHRNVQEIQHHAQLIDIPPTLARILGFSERPWNGVDLFQENHLREGRPIYSHSPQGWSMVQFDGWRYMQDAQNGEGYLYNIQEDPYLKHNLWHEEPNRREQLQEVFRASP